MNAVKRCLALFAATLVVGACSGDPTADDAGTGLTIRTTPSVVWMREDQTLELDVEAVDALGGTAPGSWTATTTGPVTAALDPNYQETSTGGLAQIRRFILTPTAAGEGSVTFTGTAGSVTVPVRIAPDPVAFAATISNENPALAEAITVTAPAGVRFTAGTVVSFVSGGLNATTNGLAAPSITAFNTDSTQITVLPAPGAFGRMRFTGVANASTPTLTTTVTTAVGDSVTVPPLSFAATYSTNPVAENTAITFTLPAGFKFRPTSQVTTIGAPAITGFTPLPAHVVSRAADSSSITIVPMPGFDTLMLASDVQWSGLPTLSLPVPTNNKLKTTLGAAVQNITDLGADNASAGPVGQATVTLAVGESTVIWDRGTWASPDWWGFGGPQQDIQLNITNAGTYTITVDWEGLATNSDVDVVLDDAGLNDLAGALTGSKPETFSSGARPAGTYFLLLGDFAHNNPRSIKIRITRTA